MFGKDREGDAAIIVIDAQFKELLEQGFVLSVSKHKDGCVASLSRPGDRKRAYRIEGKRPVFTAVNAILTTRLDEIDESDRPLAEHLLRMLYMLDEMVDIASHFTEEDEPWKT